ncbi:MAG: hypothetical protein DRI52_10445 [Chloroflexi bacterium]|nr:MAG: hypothetical protein DRI52_10445 [Chloroflexota bacterium]
MGLDIWFREDILHALKAAEQASATTAAAMEHALGGAEGSVVGDARYLRAYREGYKAALVTVAMAFGITPSDNTSGDCHLRDFDEESAEFAAFARRRLEQSVFA